MTTKEKVERLQFLVDDKIELIRWIMLGTPIFEVIPGIKCLAEFTETPVKNVYNLTCSLLDAVAPEVISFEKKPRFTESDTSSAELNNIFCRLITEYKDRLVEELWCEFEDVLMVEARAYYKNDPDYSNDISIVSGSSWQGFPAALPVEKFWEWFNNHYSNGIDCLRS